MTTPNLNKIEMFKNSNFSFIELMKKSAAANPDNKSETMSIRHGGASQISTPRLTPLKMIDRSRNQLVSKDDIDKLESKIKELEDSIFTAKKKGEEKKTDKSDQENKK